MKRSVMIVKVLVLALVTLPMAGCEFNCDADIDDSIQDLRPNRASE